MSKRIKAATVDVGLRVKEPMRARIERSAKGRGVSMNAEINARLEATFTKEELFDRFFGGPEMRQMANHWAAAFAHGAGQYSGGQFDSQKDTDPSTDNYRAGALAVVHALMVGMPAETATLFIAQVQQRFISRVVNAQLRAKGEL
jgi:Arc-like DNA binding domain